uniref:non-specific serine/threonine protein kinase n=1 Tax=Arion vulgaris TaxID=1028688 RepID=A0A0B7B2N2_9EUPU
MSCKIPRKALAIQARKKRSKAKPRLKQEDKKRTSNDPKKKHEPHYDDEEDDEEEILGSDDDEQEDPRDYCKGGYHPVKIGDLLNSRYHIVRKLGWGHFSTVWLSWDLNCKRFVALKVVKSAQHYTETALDEIKLLKCVRESDENDPHREKAVQLLDDFKISGVNGTHVCMVFEVLGNNLLKLIIRSNYQGVPLHNVKLIIKQVLEGLDYLHTKCKIIHTDIKPENILMCVDESHIRKLAADAIEFQRLGLKLPGSAVSTAPKEKPQDLSKMSKNKKKKMKKKQKKQEQLIQMQMKQLEELDREKGSDKTMEGYISEGVVGNSSAKLISSESSNSLQNFEGETNGSNDTIAILSSNDKGGGDHSTKLVNGQHPSLDAVGQIDSAKFSGHKSQTVEKNNVQTKENRRIDNMFSENSLINLSANKVDDSIMDEDSEENFMLSKSSSESPTTTIAVVNVTGENSVSNDNNKVFNDNNSCPASGNVNHMTNNAATKSSSTVPLCNGHATQFSCDSTTIESELAGTWGDGKQVINSRNKDIAGMSANVCCMSNAVSGAGESLVHDLEHCELGTPRLVNCVSVESCDGDIEDMQVEGILDDAQTSTSCKPDPVHEICEEIPVKIADLGNACWTYHQFTEDIQTRQYRCLEVLIGAGYDTPADIWSTACMAFELATGDYLFEPHSGEDYTRDEDHLAHIIELVGPIPRHIALCGKYSREFFNRRGELRHISKLKPWGMVEVLTEKYEWTDKDAQDFNDFLLPMLAFDPNERATAAECLKHPWLQSV